MEKVGRFVMDSSLPVAVPVREKVMSDKPTDVGIPDPAPNRHSQQTLTIIQEALSNLRFGQVTIVVHNGAIVQIERLEKKRLPVE
jgi:hypothetical protein